MFGTLGLYSEYSVPLQENSNHNLLIKLNFFGMLHGVTYRKKWTISTTTVGTSYLAFFLLFVGTVTHRANLAIAMT
jgi:hypothetical protein